MSRKSLDAFVGRKPEIRHATQALKNGKHVFVHGPFGIGKTTFGLRVQQGLGIPLLRVSLEDSPKQMAVALLESLTVHDYREALSQGRKHRIARDTEIEEINESFYCLKLRIKGLAHRKLVVIVDDFFRGTRPKTAFLEFLIHQDAKLIVNVESGTDNKSLQSLRALCTSQTRIDLPRLSARESRELVARLCRSYKVEGAQFDSDAWVRQFNGHPLMIVDRLRTLSSGG